MHTPSLHNESRKVHVIDLADDEKTPAGDISKQIADFANGPIIKDSAYYYPHQLFAEGHQLKVKPLHIKEVGATTGLTVAHFKRNKRIARTKDSDSFMDLADRFILQAIEHRGASYGVFIQPNYPEPTIGDISKAAAVINDLAFEVTRDEIVIKGTYVGPRVEGLWLVPVFKGENMKINELSYFLICRSPQATREAARKGKKK